jgi:hypothetical protein
MPVEFISLSWFDGRLFVFVSGKLRPRGPLDHRFHHVYGSGGCRYGVLQRTERPR